MIAQVMAMAGKATEGALVKWAAGFFAGIVLIYIPVPVFEYRLGIAGPGSIARTVLAVALAVSSIGSIVTGVMGIKRKRTVFLVPLAAGLIGLIGSAGFGFNIG